MGLRKHLLSLGLMAFIALTISAFTITPWGFWAHKRINRMAVFTLPPEMIHFYKQNIEYITEHAVDPDKRRYALKTEAEKHYIDIDHYGEWPYEEMPRNWSEAVEKYSEDTLRAFGIIPWSLEWEYKKLIKAFEANDPKKILKYSADIGHYIGDMHVPLHTTVNYNGQLTGQKGIHGFWESRVPELFGEEYDYLVGKAVYIEDIKSKIWEVVLQSSAAVDSVLSFEQDLTDSYPSDQKFSYEDRFSSSVKVYSQEFSSEYQLMLDEMIEKRMRLAIINVASFWYSAWIEAGQPDLKILQQYVPSEEDKKEEEELNQLFKEGNIKGREHQH